MSLIALLTSLLALATSLGTVLIVRKGFSTLKTHVERLLNEETRIETRRFELESELDARIKRLLARETYWRGEASRRSDPGVGDAGSTESPHGAEPQSSTGESTLELRNRLRRA